jgi:hypothetical protein
VTKTSILLDPSMLVADDDHRPAAYQLLEQGRLPSQKSCLWYSAYNTFYLMSLHSIPRAFESAGTAVFACKKHGHTHLPATPVESISSEMRISIWFRRLLDWKPERMSVGGERMTAVSNPAVDREQSGGAMQGLERPGQQSSISGVLASVALHAGEFTFSETAFIDMASLFMPGNIVGNRMGIRLNSTHPAGPLLADLLSESDIAELDIEQLRERYTRAHEALRVLLWGWAHFEAELTGVRRRRAEEVREDWGRVVRRLLSSRHG